MKTNEIRDHWTNWARTYGEHLNATTKTPTIKALEIDAFVRAIAKTAKGRKDQFTALEAGCGNGLNCMALAEAFPKASFDGIDYIPEMVDAAKAAGAKKGYDDRLRFYTGNVLDLSGTEGLRDSYDFVFTDRCLINLNTLDLQKNAISSLAGKVAPGGYLMMIENSMQTYEQQNKCREMLGMQPRMPASYNLFFDEDEILPHIESVGMELAETEDFGSLHDLLLYVLVPAANGGVVDYAHPLVETATALSQAIARENSSAFGRFGQNRLYVCRKPA